MRGRGGCNCLVLFFFRFFRKVGVEEGCWERERVVSFCFFKGLRLGLRRVRGKGKKKKRFIVGYFNGNFFF